MEATDEERCNQALADREVQQEAAELVSMDVRDQMRLQDALRVSQESLDASCQQRCGKQPGIGVLVLLRAAADGKEQEETLRAITKQRLEAMLKDQGVDNPLMVTHRTCACAVALQCIPASSPHILRPVLAAQALRSWSARPVHEQISRVASRCSICLTSQRAI
jgi:hypothetical protein